MNKLVLGIGIATSVFGPSLWAEDREAEWVKRRVQQIKESDATAWKQIPWIDSLLEARKTAAREGRPLLLITVDGNLETGRC